MSRNIKSFCSQSPASRGLALLLAAALLSAAGCAAARERDGDTLRLGVALYAQDDTFISSVTQNLERMVQESEVKLGRRINISVVDGANNQTTQLEQVDRFLDQGYDALLVNLVDRTAAAVLLDKTEEAQVPVVFFNRQPVAEDIDYRERVYYVGARAEEGGVMQGELVLDAWRDASLEVDRNGDGILQYVMLEGEPGHQDALLRTEYSVKTLTDAGVAVEKLDSDAANWKRGPASAKMAQWLDDFGDDIEVVLANNDDMALGAIDALRDWEGPRPLVVGVDATAPALDAVAAGELYGTVLNDASGIARAMLELAIALADGQDPAQVMELWEEHYVWLPYQKVNLRNLEEFS